MGNILEERFSKMRRKNGQIELLRFFCAVSVVFNHMHSLPHGSRAVEFFFLLSGFLMMRSMDGRVYAPLPDIRELLQETTSFICRKIKRVYPEIFIATAIAAGVYVLMSPYSTMSIARDCLRMFIGDICMLRMSGIVHYFDPINGPTWYIFSMLIGLVFLYPIIRRYGVSLVLFVVSLCIIGCRVRESGSLTFYWEIVGGTLWGNVRAFAVMALGACLYPVSMRFAALPLRRGCKWLCEAAIMVSVGMMALLSFDFEQGSATMDGHGIYLFFACVLIMVAFSCQGISSRLYNNKFVYFLGSFSLPLYLSHRCYSHYIPFYLPDRTEQIVAILVCSAVTALVVMYGAGVWRRHVTAENMRKWFLQDKSAES